SSWLGPLPTGMTTGSVPPGPPGGAPGAAACPSVPRYAITSARAVGSGSVTGIEVPGTFLVDDVRNSSSVLASQVRCAFIMAGVKLKPGRVPDWRPMTPANEGPKPCLPGSVVWQAAH